MVTIRMGKLKNHVMVDFLDNNSFGSIIFEVQQHMKH